MKNEDIKYEDIKYIIFIPIFGAILGLGAFAYDMIVNYPKTEKLSILLNVKEHKDSNIRFLKVKGRIDAIYKSRYGTYVGVKSLYLRYNKDSILNKNIFYIDSVGIVWFFQGGVNGVNLRNFHKQDCIEKDFGELEFHKSQCNNY